MNRFHFCTLPVCTFPSPLCGPGSLRSTKRNNPALLRHSRLPQLLLPTGPLHLVGNQRKELDLKLHNQATSSRGELCGHLLVRAISSCWQMSVRAGWLMVAGLMALAMLIMKSWGYRSPKAVRPGRLWVSEPAQVKVRATPQSVTSQPFPMDRAGPHPQKVLHWVQSRFKMTYITDGILTRVFLVLTGVPSCRRSDNTHNLSRRSGSRTVSQQADG